jgi:hypothetical protein
MTDSTRNLISRPNGPSKGLLLASTAILTAFGSVAMADITVAPGVTELVTTPQVHTTVTNDGTLNISAGGTISGATSVTNTQALNNSGAIFSVTTTNTSGVINNNGHLGSDLVNNGGQVRNNTGGNIGGNVTNNAAFRTSVGSSVLGDLTNTGSVTNRGSIDTSTGATDTVDNQGTLQNYGTVTTTTFTSSNLLSNEVGGTITTGTTTLSGRAINEGSLSGSTSVTVTGGTTTNSGTLTTPTLTVNAGATLGNTGGIVGALVNHGTTTNGVGGTISGTTLNNGVFNTRGNTYTATVTNNGTLNSNGGDSFAGLTNNGTMNVDGDSSVTGAAVSNSGTFSLISPTYDTSDRLRFTSGLTSNTSTYAVDIDLSGPTGASDQIIVTGTTTGAIALRFDTGTTPYRLQTANGGLTHVFDMGDGSGVATADVTSTGLPVGGLIAYGVVRSDGASTISATGDVLSVYSQVSPSVNALASGLSLTQDLITSVVNRPTSPFVSSLATGDECSKGGWARVSGGQATLTDTNATNPSAIDASYGGVLAGFDSGCFDGRYGGWDMAFGGSIGWNTGKTDQVLYAALTDPATGAISFDLSDPIGDISAEFDQRSYSAYLAARKDQLTVDVQLRLDQTDSVLNDTVRRAGVMPLGLTNAKYSSETTSISSRMNYTIEMNQAGMTFTPTAGLSLSQTSSSQIAFTTGETLQIEDYNTTLGFVGATLAKTVVAPSGTAGTTYFASANYYNDFSDDRIVTFRDTVGSTNTTTTSNLGGFGEISLGLNHVTILDGRSSFGAKQMNASLRLDTRFGDAIADAVSLTGQIRLSF